MLPRPILNYAWYVPEECGTVRRLIVQGKVQSAIAELERLAALGSRQAKAALAYLLFRGTTLTPTDLNRARNLVEADARAHYPYAEYMMGWIELVGQQDAVKSMKWWLGSAESAFSPAALEIARFLASDFPGKPPKVQEALSAFGRAKALHHRAAAMLRAKLLARGTVGVAVGMAAKLAMPWHIAAYSMRLRRNPFDADVFMHVATGSMDLFAST